MMGTKTRHFTPVPAVSLEELVPADHFYRHLERVLDLSFVRELVQDCYVAGLGRPSLDPLAGCVAVHGLECPTDPPEPGHAGIAGLH